MKTKVKPFGFFDGPQFFIKKISLAMKLLIAAGFTILVVSCVIIQLVMRQKVGVDSQMQEKYCSSKSCVEAAFRFQKNMDASQNPCNNFYQFACGGWERRHVITDDAFNVSIDSVLRDDVMLIMKNVLEQPKKDQDIFTTQMSKLFYQSCMQLPLMNNEKYGVRTLEAIAMAVGGLPIITKNYNTSEKTIEKIYSYALVYGSLLKNPFHFTYHVNAKDPEKKNIFKFDQPSSLGLPDFNMYVNQTYIHAYQSLLANYLRLLQEDFGRTLSNITKIVDQVIQFETKIAKAALKPKPISAYNITTFFNLENTFREFNWRGYITQVIHHTNDLRIFNQNETVNFASYSFFQEVGRSTLFAADAIETTSYLHLFNSISNVIHHLPKKYRDVYYEFSKVVFNIEKERPRFKECLDILNKFFSHAVGRIYIDESDFAEELVTQTLSMLKLIGEKFQHFITHNAIFSKDEKTSYIKALRNVEYQIGFPTWIRDNGKLEDFYQKIRIYMGHDFINNLLEVYKWSGLRFLNNYNKVVEKSEWTTRATSLDILFDHYYNTVNIPAAILQPPFFHKDYPRYLNFGALGMLLVFKSMQTIDVMEQRWNPPECLIQQYRNFTSVASTKLKRRLSLKKYLLDHVGIKQTFKAYREWVRHNGKEELRLPGLDFTPNQLLFLNFGSMWCRKNKFSLKPDSILNDKNFGLFWSLIKLNDFATTFNCQKEKCKLSKND